MREMAFYRDGPRDFASCLTRTVSTGSHMDSNLGRKQEVADSLSGSQNDGQSGKEAKICGLVLTM